MTRRTAERRARAMTTKELVAAWTRLTTEQVQGSIDSLRQAVGDELARRVNDFILG